MYVSKSIVVLALGGAALTFASTALADALPPAAEDCDSKAVGAACTTVEGGGGQAGVCTSSTCTGDSADCVLAALDAGTDAAACTTTYACVLCVASGDGGSTTVTTTDAGADAGSITTTTTTTSSSDDDSGCSVQGRSVSASVKSAAPFGLALLVPLALRRRKKKATATNDTETSDRADEI